jgi:hypothetical protein
MGLDQRKFFIAYRQRLGKRDLDPIGEGCPIHSWDTALLARVVPALAGPFRAALATLVQKHSQILAESLMSKLIEDERAEALEFVSRDRQFGQVQYPLYAMLDQIDDVPAIDHEAMHPRIGACLGSLERCLGESWD